MVENKSPAKHEVTTPVSAPAVAVAVAPVHIPGHGLAVASLVTGIVAFVFGWAFFFGFAAGVAAIILGIIALKKSAANKGMSIAGIILGSLGALWSIVVTIFFIVSLVALGTVGVAYGGAVNQANNALGQYNADNKALIDAKKDFNKGETATFGHFEIKVTNVTRNYTSSDAYSQPDAGKEFVVVGITAKNVSSQSDSISKYDLKIDDSGVLNDASSVSVDPAFDGGTLIANASVSGNIVYEVTKGSTNLKLHYETYAYDLNSGAKDLVFTLVL